MKRFAEIMLICILFGCNYIYSQQFWISQSSPTDKFLYKCEFVDSLNGWAIGEQGIIINTTNGGVNWTIQNSGLLNETLQDICFLNPYTGWIVYYKSNDRTSLLKTTNGGINWIDSSFPDTTAILGTVFFLNSTTGFLGGYSGFFKTTNSGINWVASSFDTAGCFYNMPARDIKFADSLIGYACGGIYDMVGVTWKTTDGGLNWLSSCVSPEPLSELIILGQGEAAAMGGDFEFGGISVRTTNMGLNWSYNNVGCFGDIRGFSFRTPAEVWASLSFAGYFAVNVDSMNPSSSWVCIKTPGDIQIYDIQFVSPRHGWCVGFGGSIFKYNKDIISINNQGFEVADKYSLNQNYPNPFNPETRITYSLPTRSDVKLKIYNSAGMLVRFYPRGIEEAGSYNIVFNAGSLASGVYFYVLTAGSYTESRKMVILK